MFLSKLNDFNFQARQKVLVRADLDAPLEGGIKEDSRLRECLPTVRYLLEKGVKVILLGHLGRPKGRVVKELSLEPVARKFLELLNSKFEIKNSKLKIQNFEAFQILEDLLLLENLRFYPGEENNHLEFSKKLAALGDFYVNEAFATSHRKHASIVGIPKFLPHCAGFHFASEVENLSQIIENPTRPLVVIIGGAKPETKLPLVEKFAQRADWVLVGGTLSQNPKIKNQNDNSKFKIIWAKLEESGLDISQESIEKFKEIIKTARTIVWNGPLGKYEDKNFEEGTKEIAAAIAGSLAFKVVGGGDTIAALTKFGFLDKMDYVSTGGGAMLEFLALGSLPGIEALQK